MWFWPQDTIFFVPDVKIFKLGIPVILSCWVTKTCDRLLESLNNARSSACEIIRTLHAPRDLLDTCLWRVDNHLNASRLLYDKSIPFTSCSVYICNIWLQQKDARCTGPFNETCETRKGVQTRSLTLWRLGQSHITTTFSESVYFGKEPLHRLMTRYLFCHDFGGISVMKSPLWREGGCITLQKCTFLANACRYCLFWRSPAFARLSFQQELH